MWARVASSSFLVPLGRLTEQILETIDEGGKTRMRHGSGDSKDTRQSTRDAKGEGSATDASDDKQAQRHERRRAAGEKGRCQNDPRVVAPHVSAVNDLDVVALTKAGQWRIVVGGAEPDRDGEKEYGGDDQVSGHAALVALAQARALATPPSPVPRRQTLLVTVVVIAVTAVGRHEGTIETVDSITIIAAGGHAVVAGTEIGFVVGACAPALLDATVDCIVHRASRLLEKERAK